MQHAHAECTDTFFLSLKISSKSKCEAQHQITVGSGIVSPSVTSLFAENPAGLFYNRQLKVHLSSTKLNDGHYDSWRHSVAVVTGNGTIGGGLGANRYNVGLPDSENLTMVTYGSSFILKPLNIALGVAGFTVFENPLSVIGANDATAPNVTAGAIFNPEGSFRLGVNVFDAFDDFRTYGFGLSSFLSKKIAVSIDVTASPASVLEVDASTGFGTLNTKYVWVAKPGIGVSFDSLQLSATYGTRLSAGAPLASLLEDWNRTGLSLGVALAPFEPFRILAYYNRLELYYVGVTISTN